MIGLFSQDKSISVVASGRVQCWGLSLQAYGFKLLHTSASLLGNADALSRLPVDDQSDPSILVPADWTHLVEVLGPVTAELIARETSKCTVLKKVMSFCHHGWPETLEDDELQSYFPKRSEISIQSNCLLWGTRVIVPSTLRTTLMKELHVSHPGVTRMKGLARGYVWWPKIDSDIERFVSSCSECQEQRPAPKPADLHSWQWPDRPWTRLHADYAGPCNGTYFLVIVDAFSKWVELFPTTTTSSSVTITALRSCFSRFGLPVTFVTDKQHIGHPLSSW